MKINRFLNWVIAAAVCFFIVPGKAESVTGKISDTSAAATTVFTVSGQRLELPASLNLEQAKALGLQANPVIKAAAQRLRAAAAALERARGAYWPLVNLQANALHAAEVPLTQGGGGSFELYSIKGAVSWTLFDGFRREAQVQLAEAAMLSSEAGLADFRRLLTGAMASIFYGAALTEEQLRIARQDLEFNRELAEITRKRYDAGAVSQSDLLNFQMRENIATDVVIGTDLALAQARIALAALLGIMPARLPAEVSLELSRATEKIEAVNSDVELERALTQRPELQAAYAALAAAQAELRLAQGGLWPTVSLIADSGFEKHNSVRFSSSRDTAASAGIALSWNIFAGGQTRQEIVEARAKIKIAEENLQELELKISSEVASVTAAVNIATRQVELAKNIQRQAARIRDLVRQQYEAGSETVTRLNEAQTEYIRREALMVLAELRLLQLREELKTAVGG